MLNSTTKTHQTPARQTGYSQGNSTAIKSPSTTHKSASKGVSGLKSGFANRQSASFYRNALSSNEGEGSRMFASPDYNDGKTT